MHQLPYVKVNPKQARRFAQAVGKSAWTDQVDAEMLARMGSAPDLQAQEAPHESLHDLKQLLMARRGLSKDQTAAKPRLASVTVPLLQRQSKQRLRQIARDIAQIDAGLSQQAGKDDAMAERMDILVSIPGVGKLTAITMLVDMPDLGTLDARQAAALAGLAPITQRSGNRQGVARTKGRPPLDPTRTLHAHPRCGALQSRPESEVHTNRRCRKTAKGCPHCLHRENSPPDCFLILGRCESSS